MSAHPHVLDARLQSILAELRKGLEALYGDRLAHLVLYGSQARGEAQPDSDIDVLIVLQALTNSDIESRRISHLVADLCLRKEVLVSCLFMDEDRFLHEQGPLLRNVRLDGISA